MIIKPPNSLIPLTISSTIRLISHVSSVSSTTYTQSNDQKPPNPTEYELKIQSLKNNLHPETLINILSSTHDLNSSLHLFKWVSSQKQFQHTTDTYYHIILKLGMASSVDQVEGYCNEMLKAGVSSPQQTLLKLIEEFIINHKFDAALRVFSVLISLNSYKPSVSLINRLLSVLVEGKNGIKSVLFVYKEMVKKGVCPNTETLNCLMQALLDDDRVEAAVDQYKRMRKKGCLADSRTYEVVVSGLIGKNMLDRAFVVLNDVFENVCVLDSRFFARVLPLLFRVDEFGMGLRLFEKMKSLNIVPDLLVYEVLIEYYCKNLRVDDAMDIFDEMISHDLKPSDRVFVDLMNGLCMLKKLLEARQLLEDFQVTEAASYNVLLRGYCDCQGGSSADVMWLFQEMVERNIINSRSWNVLISYLSENQRNDMVYKALTRMIVSGYEPDSVTYSALIIGKCKSNEVHDALDLFRHVREEQWVVDASCYDTLIESLCQINKIHDAVDVFRYILFNKCIVRASSFSMLIKGLCLNGKVSKVIKFLPHASYHGLSCSNEDYNNIMKSMSTLSKSDDLLTIVGRMVIEGCPLSSETYNQIIKSMSDHQRSTECALYLNRMVNEGLLPDTEILSDSLSILAQKLQMHTVLPAIHKLLSVSDRRVLNHEICNILINGLWKEGYKQEARMVLDVILENGWVPDSTTHGLLISSGYSEADEKGDTQDEIADILSEGFGEP